MTTQVDVMKQCVATFRPKPGKKILAVEQAVYEIRIMGSGPLQVTLPDGKTLREGGGLLPARTIVLTISQHQILAVSEEASDG